MSSPPLRPAGGGGEDEDGVPTTESESATAFRDSVLSSIYDAEGKGGERPAAASAETSHGILGSQNESSCNSNSSDEMFDGTSNFINDDTLGASRFGGIQSHTSGLSSSWSQPLSRSQRGHGRHQQHSYRQISSSSSTTTTTSLFGAVMRQFGGNSHHTSTTAAAAKTADGMNTNVEISSNRNSKEQRQEGCDLPPNDIAEHTTTSIASPPNDASRSMFSRLSSRFGSPAAGAGKSLMSLLKTANSPFKFRSPQLMKNKQKSTTSTKEKTNGVKRRLDLDPTSPGGATKDISSSTASESQAKRPRRNSKSNDNAAERGEEIKDEDDPWIELPIIGKHNASAGTTRNDRRTLHERMPNNIPFIDWSIKTRIRLEWHTHDQGLDKEREGCPFATHDLVSSEEWKDATTYYEFQCTATIPMKLVDNNSKKLQLRRQSSTSAMTLGGSVNPPAHESQHGVLDSLLPAQSTISSFDFAKELVRKVQGSKVQFSRHLCMETKTVLQPGLLQQPLSSTHDHQSGANVTQKQQRRQWCQAFRSLYANFCKTIDLHDVVTDDETSCSNTVLDCFFYCIGEEHVAVFCAVEEKVWDRSVAESEERAVIPSILISDCSASFRQKLLDRGRHLFATHTPDTGQPPEDSLFDFLHDIGNPLKGKDMYPSSPSPTATKKKAISPSTKADLEALRRARVFGESAGADVFVKIKNGAKEQSGASTESQNNDKKGIRLSGWDQVDLFFEVYLNTYGEATSLKTDVDTVDNAQQRLPALVCPRQLGPFSNCTLKQLSAFPVPNLTVATNSNKRGPLAVHALDVCGMILPSTVRQIILTAGKPPALSRSFHRPRHDKYLVLHTFRGKNIPPSIHGLQRSFVLNQDNSATIDPNSHRFECPHGKVLQLAVWDASGDENNVVAFRLEPVETSLLRSAGSRRRTSTQ